MAPVITGPGGSGGGRSQWEKGSVIFQGKMASLQTPTLLVLDDCHPHYMRTSEKKKFILNSEGKLYKKEKGKFPHGAGKSYKGREKDNSKGKNIIPQK